MCIIMSTTTFNWSSPITLSSSSSNSSDAQTAMDINGNIVVLWVENTFIKSSSKSTLDTWTTPVNLSTNGSSPHIVMDVNGNATAIWVERSLIKTASKTLTGTWSNTQSISASGAVSPTVTIDSAGNVIAAWVRGNKIETSTKLLGMTWQNKTSIISTSASLPCIAIGGSGSNTRAVIVWHSTSTNSIYSSTKLLNGTWSSQQVISNSSQTAMCAKVSVDNNGNAAAIWYAYTLTDTLYSNVIIQSSVRCNANGLWCSIKDLSSPGICNPASLNANIKYDYNGNAVAIWNTSFDGSNFYVQSAIKGVKGEWGATTDVATSLYGFKSDISITSNGNVLSSFMFHNGSALLILTSQLNSSNYSAPIWTVPVNVSQGTYNGFPHLATSIQGNNINAVIVWLQSNGSYNVVQVVTGSQLLAQPPSNLVVTQHTNNFGIFTEYCNVLQWTPCTDPNVNYAIYRNGKFINKTSATTYIDNNQTQNGSAVYGVATINNQQSQSKIINYNLF